jgi:hypothetical protein
MNIPNDEPEFADRISDLSPEKDHYATMLHACRIEEGKLRRKNARLLGAIRLANTFSTEPRVKAILSEAIENA